MNSGTVYILTNEAMPGYVKIGFTQQDDVSTRIRQLDNTAIPVPFECYFAAHVPDCKKLEKTLHFVFGERRKRSNREFFTINPDLAKAIIELVAVDKVTLTDEEQSIDPVEREEIDELRSRREVRTFTSMGVPIGSVLTFLKDEGITCVVAAPRRVLYDGEEISPSAAALRVIQSMGYNWPAISGMGYWMYNGVRLADIQMGVAQESSED